jgi:aspartyl protease family protein
MQDGLGDDMLRSAILMAIGAVVLGLLAPDLLSLFLPAATQDARPAASAPAATPVRADAALSGPAAPAGYSEASIPADAGGQYAAGVEINGQNVRMLVDTGATMVVISYDTASQLGLRPVDADYTARVRTANGVAAVAPVVLRAVEVGPIYVGDVQALIAAPSAGPINLLGESFLKRLASVEQRSGRLVLRQ